MQCLRWFGRLGVVIGVVWFLITTSTMYAAALLPDEGMLTYIPAEQYISRIYLKDIARNYDVSLFPPSLIIYCFDWSPDGNYLVFLADQSNVREIYVYAFATGVLEQLTHNDLNESCPRWSSNGDKIGFIKQGTGYVIDFASGSEALLRETKDGMIWFDWSPDERYVVYMAFDLYLIDLNTGTSKQLTSDRQIFGFPSWSPDGRYLVFQSDTNLYAVAVESGEIEPLTSDISAWLPSWSPTRNEITFLLRESGIYYDIYKLDFNLRTTQQLVISQMQTELPPAWSSDGNKLAAVNGDGIIFIVNHEGQLLQYFENRRYVMHQLAWHP